MPYVFRRKGDNALFLTKLFFTLAFNILWMVNNRNINRLRYAFILLVCGMQIIYFTGCLRPDEISEIPEILDVSLSKNTVKGIYTSDAVADSFKISLNFQDGDGDVGINESDSSTNLFITDMRRAYTDSFRIPNIPSFGNYSSVRGLINVNFTMCCVNDDNEVQCLAGPDLAPKDTAILQIQIKDRAGNLSNVINTPPIILLCE